MGLFKLAGLTGVTLAVSVMSTLASAMPLSDEAVTKFSRDVLFGTGRESDAALRALAARKNPDVVAVLVQALRIRRRDRAAFEGRTYNSNTAKTERAKAGDASHRTHEGSGHHQEPGPATEAQRGGVRPRSPAQRGVHR